jgi:hypothetical protein
MPASRFAGSWMQEIDALYRNARHLNVEQARDGFITSYNPQTGEIKGVTSTGNFSGQMPEIASGGGRIAVGYSPQGCLVMRNRNQAQPTVVATVTPDLQTQLTKYRAGVGFFRPLEAGAVELRSAGLAGVFADNYGTLELRGGVAMGTISHERLAVEWRAPCHRRLMHTNNDYLGGDAEVFGTVMRHLNPLDPLPQPLPEPTNPTSFAKEYSRTLSGPLTKATNVREGTVLLDDLGLPLLSGKGVPLRAIHEYGGLVPGASSSWKVDQIGNMEFTTGVTAVAGVSFSSLTGMFSVLAGLGVSLTSPLKVDLKAPAISQIAATTLMLQSLGAATLSAQGALTLTGTGTATLSSAAALNLLGATVNLGSATGVGLVTELTLCPYTGMPHGVGGIGPGTPAGTATIVPLCTKSVRVNPL